MERRPASSPDPRATRRRTLFLVLGLVGVVSLAAIITLAYPEYREVGFALAILIGCLLP
jgi:uncharacterized membrane protein